MATGPQGPTGPTGPAFECPEVDFAYALGDGVVSVIDMATHQIVRQIHVPEDLNGIAVNPNNGEIYATQMYWLYVLDGMTGEIKEQIPVDGISYQVVYNRASNRILVRNAYAASNRVLLFDADTYEQTGEIWRPNLDLLSHPERPYAYSLRTDAVDVIEAAYSALETSVESLPYYSKAFGLEPGQNRLYVLSSFNDGGVYQNVISVIDTVLNEVAGTFTLPETASEASALYVNPVYRQLYVYSDGYFLVYDAQSFTQIDSLYAPDYRSASVDPATGQFLIYNGETGALEVYQPDANGIAFADSIPMGGVADFAFATQIVCPVGPTGPTGATATIFYAQLDSIARFQSRFRKNSRNSQNMRHNP